MLKTINSDGSLKISLIGSAVPAGAVYNDGLAYAPDGSLYVKLTQGALSGQVYNGGLACTPDGAVYVANSTPAASATFRRGLLCRADGAVHVSDATVVTVRHDGGIPKDNAGRLFVGIPLAGLALATDAATGVTSSGGFASAWADQSGNGRNLLQATGANQPIHLPFSGTKYGWLPGVAGNYFSTPDSVSLTGVTALDIRAKIKPVAIAAGKAIIANDDNTNRSFLFYQNDDKLMLAWFNSAGTLQGNVASSACLAAGTEVWGRVVVTFSTGNYEYFTSTDYDPDAPTGGTWTSRGTQSAGASSLKDVAVAVTAGAQSGGTLPFSGNISRGQIFTTIGGASPIIDFDPSRWTSGTTFTASTGETWTINSTGSKPAQIVDRASLLFDGAAHYMKTAPFTLNQPETIYFVGKQISWTGSDVIADGDAANTLRLYQTTASPQLFIYGGASLVGPVLSLAVGDKGVVGIVVNGDSSSIQHNLNTPVTGAGFGAVNMGGLTLGAKGDLVSFGNIQVYEALIYATAHDAPTRANVIRALMSKWGIT